MNGDGLLKSTLVQHSIMNELDNKQNLLTFNYLIES